MAKPSVYPLIFTDLDGTLLDHDSYSAIPADRMVRHIIQRAIGTVVPVTSKTHAELRRLERSLPFEDTLSVTENGSVIHIPPGYPFAGAIGPHAILSGLGYSEILDRIGALPQRLRQHIRGFADMPATEVAKTTGLGLEEARLARQRDASEPFLWSGSDAALAELEQIMARAQIRIQRGGRFYHLTGDADKAQAMRRIAAVLGEQKPDSRVVSIALGDGPNDLGMIEAADIGVIMPNPEGVAIRSASPTVRTAPAAGPHGWVVAVCEIFGELGLNLPES